MLELALRIPGHASEDVLDRLLLIAPHGVHEVPRGDEMELRVRGAAEEMPTAAAVAATAGELQHTLAQRALPDEWDARRRIDYEPRVVAGRIVVRPEWAPAADEGLIDLVLGESDAFGAGEHPTTWACLECLCSLATRGSLADLGCGSGVLAIAAALLGFDGVSAVDNSPIAVAATRANAERNGVEVGVEALDLCHAPPPPAAVVIANVPPLIHAQIARRVSDETCQLIASGVLTPAVDDVVDYYAEAGFTETDRRDCGGWAVLTLSRSRASSDRP